MATVTVNGSPVELGDNERLNLIQAAKRAGVEVPHYCWHSELSVVASCRMCLVEAGDTKPDGTVAMQPKLVPACQTPARHGSVVITNSAKVRQAQRATLEYLLLNHPLDCPTCDQAGECFLQDYSFKYGNAQSRLQEPKLLRDDKPHIGDHITLFTDRCVMCTRCVRFTREISGTAELHVIDRGSHSEIDIFPGDPCNNKLAGNVVDLCPVGALCSKDFLYKHRVWWLRSTESVCPLCSTGCSIHVDQNANTIYRLRPRSNPLAQGEFMCDLGRFGFGYVAGQNRLLAPMKRDAAARAAKGAGVPIEWKELYVQVRDVFGRDDAQKLGSAVGLFSPFMTCEEAYLLAKFLRGRDENAKLVLGPVPVEGDDDHYPKGTNGHPAGTVRFTIRAEKCPNRRGVEAVLRHFQGDLLGAEALWNDARSNNVRVLYAVGGYPGEWMSESDAEMLRSIPVVIVQDILDSAASKSATYVIPGGSFAERDGTFVNHAGLAQAIKWAIRSPEGARQDGRILSELSERSGFFHAPTVRAEMAKEIPYFAPFGDGAIGEKGVRLEPK